MTTEEKIAVLEKQVSQLGQVAKMQTVHIENIFASLEKLTALVQNLIDKGL